MMKIKLTTLTLALAAITTVHAQQAPAGAPNNGGGVKPPAGVNLPAGVVTPPDYVIGAEDVLSIVFWKDKDMSSDVTVRPDGQITLPLLNDVRAAGLTPQQLREKLTAASAKYVAEPNVSVVVKAINSRKVHIIGMVSKPGPYPLTGPTTVLQILATAGGVHEFAKSKEIKILRTDEKGVQVALKFNYKDVMKGKNLKQNIELKPGDTIIVP
jgi:polysaccharide biosynthesis/export protein